MITVLVHQDGQTRKAEAVDPAWLRPDSAVEFWVDLVEPSDDDRCLLSDLFHFHELAV